MGEFARYAVLARSKEAQRRGEDIDHENLTAPILSSNSLNLLE
jgi:hypothetical protein